MPIIAERTRDGLKYIQFESMCGLGLRHGFFTRHGGVSPKPFDSLNMLLTASQTRSQLRQCPMHNLHS